MKTFDGRVIKAVASKFFVDTDGGVKVCFARKKLKSAGNIFVGDYVTVAKDRDSFVIEEVKPRSNQLIRPYVSNIDVCFIVVACEPQPDFMLVDKIIVNCLEQRITPVLVKNKCDVFDVYDDFDLSEHSDVFNVALTEQIDIFNAALSEYKDIIQIVECSAENLMGTDALAQIAKGKTVCFAGQSAVGKSSLINAMLGSDVLQVGELAKKIKRGKNTTRRTEILSLGSDTYLVDTCGFSMLEAIDIPPENLRLYYDDFEQFRPMCKFSACTHIGEPDCAVKPHVGREIGGGRYQRYKTLFDELKQRRDTKYD